VRLTPGSLGVQYKPSDTEANNLKPSDTRKTGLKLTTNQNGYKAEVRLLTMILRKFKHLH